MDQEEQAKQQIDLFNQAVDNPTIPKIYINGFFIGSTNADITVVAQQNARPTAVFNMSYGIAKTLVEKLANTISQIESVANTKVLTTDDMDKALKSSTEKNK